MNKILATVGTLQVTEAEVDAFLANLGPRGQSYNNPEGRKAVLEQIIGNKLLLLEAKKNLFEIEPEFKAALAQAKDTLLTNYALEKVFSAVKVSDKEIADYYEANKAQLESGETVNASHILVDSEELAKEIRGKIASGEISFEDAAKEYSSCPSKQNGGNLGDFGKGQMVPEFDTAVFAMEIGELSEPVKTQFGYHLIKLNAKNESTVPSLDEIKEELREGLLGEKRRAAYESKVRQLSILFPVDRTI